MGWNSQDIMFEGSCTLLTVAYHVPDTAAREKNTLFQQTPKRRI